MKFKHLFIITLLFISSCAEEVKVVDKIINEVDGEKIKSIYKIQNDTIVGIEIFDETGHLVFKRTTQIIEDWDNNLMSWMTAYEFKNNQLIYEYYAHSNTGLSIKYFDYDQDGKLKNEYTRYFDRNGQHPFSEIYEIETADSLITYLKTTIPDSIVFENHTEPLIENQQFSKTYFDTTNKVFVKEYWTIEQNTETSRVLEKYDSINRLVSKHCKTEYNEIIELYKYDTLGNLIEEIERYGSSDDNFQRKEHFYKSGLLQKTLFYHDTSLAFTYEYFYKDSLLVKEIKNRITKSEHFKNRPKTETITYQYNYY